MSVNNSPKKLVITTTVYEDLDMCGMEVREIIATLQKLVDDYPDATLVAHSTDSYSYSAVDIEMQRVETDKEYDARQTILRNAARKKENQKKMNALMKKDSLTEDEKLELIKYIQEK